LPDGDRVGPDARADVIIPHEMRSVTVAERPDLTEPAWELTRDAFPKYNNHGDVLNLYWARLIEERPEFQFHLVDADDAILARARSLPVRWDGSVEDLPAGIDGAIARGFEEDGANTLCAMLIAVPRSARSRGLSTVALQAMLELARQNGLQALIAPVRPSWKERYPLMAIEEYAAWRRADGLLFDPWMRAHERIGATVLKPERHSMRITGGIADWEQWTGMAFAESGDHRFPGGLATVTIDHDSGSGSYWEPNVWMQHKV
jgi:GNAT superfamily N-acetyltransferase